MEKTTKYQLLELQIPIAGAGQRIYFQDQPQLRSQSGTTVFIESIETFGITALALSPFSANTVATLADIINGVLVLNVGGYEDIQAVPLALLNRVNDHATIPFSWDLFTLNDLYKVDWTKSYVQIQAANAAAFSYIFGVRYRTTVGVRAAL